MLGFCKQVLECVGAKDGCSVCVQQAGVQGLVGNVHERPNACRILPSMMPGLACKRDDSLCWPRAGASIDGCGACARCGGHPGNMPALDDELHVPHGAAYCSFCM